MINTITNTFRQINSSARPLNILTFPTHEGYATMLSYIPKVTFNVIHVPNGKLWDFHTREFPSNHVLHLIQPQNLGDDVRVDAILSQERSTQLPIAKSLGQSLGVPVISLNHTEPYPHLNKKQLAKLCQNRGDINIYITKHNQASWNDMDDSIVIPHGIDTNLFSQNGNQYNTMMCAGYNKGVVIANQFKSRNVFLGYSIYNQVRKEYPIDIIGEPDADGGPEYLGSLNKVPALVSKLCEYGYYANFTQHSPLPLSLLEAAALGMPIITTDKQQIGSVFKHEQNALIANNPGEFKECIKRVIDDRLLACNLGAAARKTIETQFSIDSFVKNWQKVFSKI